MLNLAGFGALARRDIHPIQLVFDDERRLSFQEVEPEEYTLTAETKIERAMSILLSLLEDGPMPVSEINVLMKENDIGPKTAQRARAKMSAIQFYDDGVACWNLP